MSASGAWGGLSQGIVNGMQMYGQIQGLQRQKELNAQQDQEFQWKKDRVAQEAETTRQQNTLADDMQRGAIDNNKVATKLNGYQDPNTATPDGAQTWTPQQVGALTRGPGSAFDPNAGPALPNGADVRTPMKDSEVQGRMGALALRKGDIAGATAAQTNAKALKIDEGVQEYMQSYDKNPGAFNDHLMQLANDKKVPHLSIAKNPKTGYFTATVIDDNQIGTPVQLDGTQMRQLALSTAYMQAGAYDKGLGIAAGVNKDLADAMAKSDALKERAVQINNTGQHYAGMDARDQARLGIESARLTIAQQQARRGEAVQLVDKDGNAHLYYLPTNTGPGEVKLPDGLFFPKSRPMPNEAAVQKYAEAMVGQPVTTPDGRPIAGPDGKPQKYTPLTARRAVLQDMGYGDRQGGPGGLVVPQGGEARAAAIAALPGKSPAAKAAPQAAAPQGDNTVFGIRPRRVQSGDDIARQQGWQPAGQGNSMFGAGETLYVNPQTGEKRWASSFEQ